MVTDKRMIKISIFHRIMMQGGVGIRVGSSGCSANNKFSYQQLPPTSKHFTHTCIQFPIRQSYHRAWYHCTPLPNWTPPPPLSNSQNILAGFSFCPFGFWYYLLPTPPLITNVTPLRVPLGASLRPNLRPPGKFPLMLTIGGENNMSPAHRDKVFCRIRQSGKMVLFAQQKTEYLGTSLFVVLKFSNSN